MTELEKLTKLYEETGARIEALKAVKVWIPPYKQVYWYNGASEVFSNCFYNQGGDREILRHQRVYPTKAEAEANNFQKEKIAIWNKFREMETEAVDWGNRKQAKYQIGWDYSMGRPMFDLRQINCVTQELEWYTTSLEACTWVVHNMLPELKKLWRVPNEQQIENMVKT